MKILIVYRSLKLGGVQRMMVKFANFFANKGYDISFLLFKKEGVFISSVSELVTIEEIPQQGKLSRLPFLIQYIKEKEIDIIFTATPSLNLLVIIAKLISKRKIKTIISERSNTIKEFKGATWGMYKLSFLLIPFLYRFSNAIIAVSHGVAKDLKKIALISLDRISVIYNPVYDNSHKDISSQNIILDQWLAQKEFPVIIAAGRLHYQKNFELLIRSIQILCKDIYVRLIILGEGEEKENLQALINDLNLKENIKLLGFKENPKLWIKEADIFVLSSRWEGFGNILIDALSVGKTIVSTNCKSGPAEILDNGNFGYLLQSMNANEMASLIKLAIDNPLNEDMLINRAKMFSEDLILQKYEDLITHISQIK